MEQIARQISESLLQELPDQSQYVTPGDLLPAGFPQIVVETLQKNIQGTIESEVTQPESEWIQTDSEAVAKAWNHYVDTSLKHVKIPSSKLSYLLKEAVEQCLELAVQPRKAVPEIIFRAQEKISLETARKRVSALVVNRQLGVALIRYMEKKEKIDITIDHARHLVKKIDEKLTENYHPLNWAQVLKPVFDLTGPSVDTELIRLFFEDKEQPAIAQKFDLSDKGIAEAEFIEILSSADLLDGEESKEENQSGLIEAEEPDEEPPLDEETVSDRKESVEKDKDHVTEEPEPHEDEEVDEFEKLEDKQEAETSEIEESEEESDKKEENIVDLFSSDKNQEEAESNLGFLKKGEGESSLSLVEEPEESGDEHDNVTLLNKFIFDESPAEEDDKTNESEDPEKSEDREPSSIYEEMNLVQDNSSEETAEIFDEDSDAEEDAKPEEAVKDDEEELSYKISPKQEELEENEEEPEPDQTEIETEDFDAGEGDDEEDQPMWRSFLERDDIETDSGYEYDDEDVSGESEEEDDGFIEEPIYDLTTSDPKPEEKLNEVSKWLDDEKDRFVEQIFENSEKAYEQALIEIMDFDNWKSASAYLEKEVFSRNRIDVYDEAAVDFTDRLHSYFMENKS